MKTCIPGCEFLVGIECKLHETTLNQFQKLGGKVHFIRCKPCEQEKEVFDIIQDLDSLNEVLKKYEDEGIFDAPEADQRR